ncbi:MAG: YqgE/AlgH family protein [Planctomycetota bacterium]
MSDRVEPGTLLLSAPSMQDPNFMHSVVLMCQHDDESAFGLVVNRPAKRTIDELFPEHPVLSDVRLSVRAGGPVGLDTLQVVHRVPVSGPGSHVRDLGGVDLGAGVRIGADLDEVARYARDAEDPDGFVRFVVGYAGWGAGQLESEIQIGSWLPLAATADVVFSKGDSEAVWRDAIGRLGHGGSSLAHHPPDPSWN